MTRTEHRPAHTQGTAISTDLRPTTNAGGPRRAASHVSASRATRSGLVVLVLIAGGVALALGEREAERPGLRDSVRLNDSLLQITRALSEVTAVGTVGILLVLAGLVPAGLLAAHPGPAARLARLASRWAAAWAAASALRVALTAADIAGVGLGELVRSGQLSMIPVLPPARALLSTTAVAVVVAVGARSASSRVVGRTLLLLALAGLVPPLLTSHVGHQAGSALALASLTAHVPAVSLWVGGLMALVLHLRGWRPAMVAALARFSPLAAACCLVVAISGVVAAVDRLPGWQDLPATAYGQLVLLKLVALVVLASFGALHRLRTLPAVVAGRERALLRLAGVELGVMAAAMGVAAALSTTTPPL